MQVVETISLFCSTLSTTTRLTDSSDIIGDAAHTEKECGGTNGFFGWIYPFCGLNLPPFHTIFIVNLINYSRLWKISSCLTKNSHKYPNNPGSLNF